MNKRAILVAVAASAVIVLLWFLVLWSPESHSLHKAHVETTAAESQQASLRAQIATLKQEQAALSGNQAKLTALELDLPNTPALDKLIDDLNADAAKNGVDWQNITPAKPATYAVVGQGQGASPALTGGMQVTQVALQVKGSYPQVTAFITGLNAMPRLFDVDSVSLSGVGPSAAQVTAQISGQIFFIPAATGSTTATTVAP